MAEFNLVPLLAYINPDADYLTWTQVGMALKHEGYPVSVWEDWSRGGSKYHEGECAKKWQTFNENTGDIVTGATITRLAKAGGWVKDKPLDPFNIILTDADLFPAVDIDFDDEPFPIPNAEEWNRTEDLINYLKALFRSDEYVGIALHSVQSDDGKYRPLQNDPTRQLQAILADLKKIRAIWSSHFAVSSPTRQRAHG